MESSFISPYRDDIVISWPELHRDTRVLCHALMAREPFKGIIAITRGGMIPAALVARELEIRLIDTICAASYDESVEAGAQNKRSAVKIIKGIDHDGEGYLLIDDLVDTGNTARVIRKQLPKAFFVTTLCQADGARSCRPVREGIRSGQMGVFPLGYRLQVRAAAEEGRVKTCAARAGSRLAPPCYRFRAEKACRAMPADCSAIPGGRAR